MLKKIQKLILKNPWRSFSLAVLISLLGIMRGINLPVNLSLNGLLPDERPSIIDMNIIIDELGGIGYLLAVVGPIENPQTILPTMAQALKDHPEIKYTYYRKDRFELQDKFLYILSNPEFKKVRKHAKALFSKGKSNFNLGLDSQEIKNKRISKAKNYFSKMKKESDSGEFFLSKDKRYAMFMIKPIFNSTHIKRSEDLVASVQKRLDQAIKGTVPFQLTGRYVNVVNDSKQFKGDVALTGTISLVCIALLLCFGLGTLRGALLTVLGIVIAMGWTIGIAHQLVGQINVITGFLLAILGGLGAEYSIHLIRRYYQYTDSGVKPRKAIELTYYHMGRALFSAAITSAAAFLILAISDFRGFRELGIIAGGGILSIYWVYMLCFPLFAKALREKPRFQKSINLFAFFPVKQKWVYSLLVIIPLLIFGVSKYEFEYDFDRMFDYSKETQELKELTNSLFGKSLTPAALLATSKSQAKDVEEALKGTKYSRSVDKVISLATLVPPNMEQRERQLKKLKRLLDKSSDREIARKMDIDPQKIRRWVEASPYTASDLPVQLRTSFGPTGNVVLVYPKERLDYADTIHRFANTLRDMKKDFKGLVAGNGNIIFDEIIHHVTYDGMIVLLLFLIGAFFIFWLDFQTLRGAFILELQLVLGIFVLVGLMGVFGIRFTIFNITMIPAVLAAGVDMGVHVRHQEKDGSSSLQSARYIAQAVQLSALTTAVGFGALFFAQANVLRGIAWISVLGQLSMYLICMIFFPAIKDFIYRRQSR